MVKDNCGTVSELTNDFRSFSFSFKIAVEVEVTTMNIQTQLIFSSFLLSLILFISLISASHETEYQKLIEEFKNEKILRHVEIRKELERDATPFLEHTAPKLNVDALNINLRTSSMELENIPTSWTEFLSTFALMDFIMGIFSLISLGFGTIYMILRFNPFADKVEK